MTISMQTLHDVLVALVTTVGIGVTASILFLAAGALFEIEQRRTAGGRGPVDGPAQHPAQTDDVGDLLLR
jgi:hypothetical protein